MLVAAFGLTSWFVIRKTSNGSARPRALDMNKNVLLIGEQRPYQPAEDKHNVCANIRHLWTVILPTK